MTLMSKFNRDELELRKASRALSDLTPSMYRHKDVVERALRFYLQEFLAEDLYRKDTTHPEAKDKISLASHNFTRGYNKCVDDFVNAGVVCVLKDEEVKQNAI